MDCVVKSLAIGLFFVSAMCMWSCQDFTAAPSANRTIKSPPATAIRPSPDRDDSPQAGDKNTTTRISGWVTDDKNRGIGKVSVAISGGAYHEPQFTYTNDVGIYSFPQVPTGRWYVVTVHSDKYSFSRPSKVITAGYDLGDLNFVGRPTH
jgi:hypothetical protein